jgi:hypothetical protein
MIIDRGKRKLEKSLPQCHYKKPSVDLVRWRTMPTERPPLLGEVVPTFAVRGYCVVSATDPPGR